MFFPLVAVDFEDFDFSDDDGDSASAGDDTQISGFEGDVAWKSEFAAHAGIVAHSSTSELSSHQMAHTGAVAHSSPSELSAPQMARAGLPRNSSELSAHRMGRHPCSDFYVIRDILARVSFALVPASLRPQSHAVRSGTYVWFYAVLRKRQGCSTTTRSHSGSSPAQVRCHEDIVAGFRRNRIKSQAVFIALDGTVDCLTQTLRRRLGWMQAKAFPQTRTRAARRSTGREQDSVRD